MREETTTELWQRRYWDDGTPDCKWHRANMRLTGTRRDLNRVAQFIRQGHYLDAGEWWDFEFRELPEPINSHKNPILADFRDMIDRIIDPYVPKEAAWRLELIESDPLIQNVRYWGDYLVDEIDANPVVIEQAVRVLTRLKNLGM